MQKLTERQKQALKAIYNSIKDSGYPPTLADLREELNVSSNQAVLDLLKILESKSFIKKEEGMARGIKILNAGYRALETKPMIPFKGVSAAGGYMQIYEDIKWEARGGVDIAGDNVFLVKVNGDSMVGAGINDGDIVIIKEMREFKNGDIVLSRNDGESTIKRLVHDDGKVYLKPENPKYKNVPIYPETRLIGKIIGTLGKS